MRTEALVLREKSTDITELTYKTRRVPATSVPRGGLGVQIPPTHLEIFF